LPDAASTGRAAGVVARLFRVVIIKIGTHRVTDRPVVALALQGRKGGTGTEQANQKNGDSYRTDASIEHVLRPPEV
jgi:hypothetical protein